MPRISERIRTILTAFALVTVSITGLGWAAGDLRFTFESPAGFWAGLWHGMIAVITLIVGLFHDGVQTYERSNTGGWYDVGFLLGVTIVWGGGSHTVTRRSRSKRERQAHKEWEEFESKVQAKLERMLRQW